MYRGAAACDGCGACAKSGWKAEADYDGLDLPDPDEAFDYEAFIEEEFGSKAQRMTEKRKWARIWWWTAVALLLAFLLSYFL